MKTNIKYTYPAFALASLLFLVSCGNHEEKKEVEEAPVKPAATQGFLLKKGNLSSSLIIPGELIAFQQVDLYAKISSFVKKLYADVGTEVKEGQLLVVLDAPEINSQVAAAESRLKAAEATFIASKANFDRIKIASQTAGTISPNDLDLALARQNSDKAQYESMQAAYKEVQVNRGYLTIRAPFTGVITARNVSAGAYVGPSGKGSELPIFTLQEQKKMRLVVDVPDAFTGYLRDKGKVDFTVKSLPGQTFKASINRLAGALDLRLRSQRTEMDVYSADKTLLPGMVAEVTIPLPAKNSTFIAPSSAVINSDKGIYVVKVSDGLAQWIPVRLGRTVNKSTEIYGAISEGDTLLSKASEENREHSPVQGLTISKAD